ncbi:MAG: hypothetical protein M3P23_05160 [Actinomycetota bacterium]|nr:hypothetical protein [Actinomycetota bacterium]
MKHLITATGVGAAAVALSAGLVLSSLTSSASSATPKDSDRDTLHFDVTFSPFFFLDLGKKQFSMGDEIVAHDQLLDASGAVVGHNGVSCIMTAPRQAEAECTATFSLPHGTITTQFLNSPPSVKTMAVTGGTARYRDVSGQGVLVENGDDTGTITFQLID